MPKTKISEFSSTPANNTDIDSINIAENCPPSGINDAIRELMAQLKDFQTGAVGDSFNGPVGTTTAAAGAFTTLSASGAVTLSGGTANGVAYLNGSKVVTSGSALTFDGSSRFLVNGVRLDIDGGTSADQLRLGTDPNYYKIGRNSSSGPLEFYGTQSGVVSYVFGGINGEYMRLTSTGLGIGTSSPAGKVHASNSYSNSSDLSFVAEANISGYNLRSSSGGRLSLVTGYIGSNISSLLSATGTSNPSDELMRFNHSSKDVSFLAGNLGLGVTPSAWRSTFKAMEIGRVGNSIFGGVSGSSLECTSNVYLDTTSTYRYANNGAATDYYQQGGSHAWLNAPSGTAGNAITFTQAMTLDASGNLLVGNTTSSFIASNRSVLAVNGSVSSLLSLQSGSTDRFYIIASSAQVDIATATAIPLTFATNGTERARIDSSGNLLIGRTSLFGSERVSIESASSNTLLTTYNFTATSVTHHEIRNQNGVVGSIVASGGSTSYNTSSDQRLKENIANADSASALIDSLQVRKFDWKADGSHQRYGFVAQELVTAVPEAVYQPEDTEQMMAVDYSKLVPMLVKEVQSLRKRLADAGL